ncbi:hypothetical protein BDN71DRAFT_1061028 [Pleurotus eryngii]|uniref:Uncharacterized protein n=1 Tax=Pleurotus eryngii TaxID=5323 RepID=A0A9P5ZV97_PLEER|nr:hypothetical protein BDN71DRAFT_1061028 [Pleurotus eryngii]
MSSSLPLNSQSSSKSHSFHTKPLSLSPTNPTTPPSPHVSRKHRPPSISVTQNRSQLARRQSSISMAEQRRSKTYWPAFEERVIKQQDCIEGGYQEGI